MSKTPLLQDFETWRSKNSPDFSMHDYLYGRMEVGGISPDLFVAFTELFWPTAIDFDGLVFLGARFSDGRLAELRSQGYDGKELEYWMNLVSLDGMVQLPSTGRPDDFRDHALYVAKNLEEMWTDRLRRLFPEKRFLVKVIDDFENGDVCITFYQTEP